MQESDSVKLGFLMQIAKVTYLLCLNWKTKMDLNLALELVKFGLNMMQSVTTNKPPTRHSQPEY